MNGRAGVVVVVATLIGATGASAQDITFDMMRNVMPAATRFEEPDGVPAVRRAYRDSVLIGFVFRSADAPPERLGYSGPVQTLIGLDLNGVITGVMILEYWESHRSTRGDFLRVPGVQEQFGDMHIADPFVIGQDIDGISRATVSVRALARGVRDAARRVSETYLASDEPVAPDTDPTTMSWFELLRSGLVTRLEVSDGQSTAEIYLAHIADSTFGETFVGGAALGMLRRAVERRDGRQHMFAYAVDGPPLQFFNRTGWSIVQGNDTTPVVDSDVFSFGLASGGMLDVEVATGGGMLIDPVVDIERPFTIVFRSDSTIAPFTAPYLTAAARRAEPG